MTRETLSLPHLNFLPFYGMYIGKINSFCIYILCLHAFNTFECKPYGTAAFSHIQESGFMLTVYGAGILCPEKCHSTGSFPSLLAFSVI